MECIQNEKSIAKTSVVGYKNRLKKRHENTLKLCKGLCAL